MRVGLVPLGCSKNLVDSEMILGVLKKLDFEIVGSPDKADLLIINTCGFIQSAKEEAIETIFQMVNYKKTHDVKIMVTGCLSQRYKEMLIEELPEVDMFVSIDEYDHIGELICNLMGLENVNNVKSVDFMARVLSTAPYFSYVRIGDGCDNKCSYCAIPLIRGPYVSRYISSIVEEVKQHIKRGRKEIVLIAQDTTRFGKENDESLAKLLLELVKIEDLEMIRILYMYVSDLTEEVIQIIKKYPKIAPYFDLPIQHASNKMLRLMNRRDTKEIIMDKINHIKQEIPHAIIRTTLIVGFPHETENDFNELLELVNYAHFDRLGCFTYSPEEDTKGYDMDEQVDENIKQERHKKIMEAQQKIAYKKGKERIGQITEVYIDRFDPKMNMYKARDYSFAPDDVDGCIYVNTKKPFKSGSKVKVKITSNYIYDLVAELVE